MANTFDSSAFLNQDTEGANDTQSILVPEGEYTGVIDKLDIQQFTKMEDGEERTSTVLNVSWLLDDPNQVIEKVTARKKNIGRQSVFLDLTPEGGLDMGRGMNAALGRLREAVGQNDPTRRWNMQMLKGQAAKVTIKHRTDKEGAQQANVTKVAALG